MWGLGHLPTKNVGICKDSDVISGHNSCHYWWASAVEGDCLGSRVLRMEQSTQLHAFMRRHEQRLS